MLTPEVSRSKGKSALRTLDRNAIPSGTPGTRLLATSEQFQDWQERGQMQACGGARKILPCC
eukprot:4718762-Amphidinium_carterae.2